MSKLLLQQVDEYTALYRDTQTGIAWVEDGHTGSGHSAHPNISATGSIRGMKAKAYWGKYDRCLRSHGFIYNTDRCLVSEDDPLDELARQHCQCGGRH
jgi:hypothetical protein